MARRVDRSASAVRYWLKKYGYWPLPATRRREAVRRARQEGLASMQLDCKRHGATEFVIERTEAPNGGFVAHGKLRGAG